MISLRVSRSHFILLYERDCGVYNYVGYGGIARVENGTSFTGSHTVVIVVGVVGGGLSLRAALVR